MRQKQPLYLQYVIYVSEGSFIIIIQQENPRGKIISVSKRENLELFN